eukprot:1193000-Prorocentrum_minimum.AAC.4
MTTAAYTSVESVGLQGKRPRPTKQQRRKCSRRRRAQRGHLSSGSSLDHKRAANPYRVLETQCILGHQPRTDHRGAPRAAGLTMHQHSPRFLTQRIVYVFHTLLQNIKSGKLKCFTPSGAPPSRGHPIESRWVNPPPLLAPSASARPPRKRPATAFEWEQHLQVERQYHIIKDIQFVSLQTCESRMTLVVLTTVRFNKGEVDKQLKAK